MFFRDPPFGCHFGLILGRFWVDFGRFLVPFGEASERYFGHVFLWPFAPLPRAFHKILDRSFESCVALAPLSSSALLVCPGVFCGPLFPFPLCTSAARERAKRAKRAERLSGVPLCFLCSSASWCSPCLFDLLGFLFVWFRVSPFLWNDRASRSHAKTGS